MSSVACVEFLDFRQSVAQALDAIAASEILAQQSHVLLKPNLVNSSSPPITTPWEFCEAVILYVREHSQAEIVIAEGSGDVAMDTPEIFDALGYTELAARFSLELVDLNDAPLKTVYDSSRSVFPEMHLPEIAFTHYVVSLPVLKRHSLASITGCLKNMMGFAPPEYYSGGGGSWKKAVFHLNMQESIKDLVSYRAPDLSVMDATVGMSDYHLGGRRCSPPVNKILAGFDPLAVDRESAKLLGLDWRTIGHLR